MSPQSKKLTCSIIFTVFLAFLSGIFANAQTFTATSTPMNMARWLQATSPLPNGRALITGGSYSGSVITGNLSAEIFDPTIGANGGFTPTTSGLNTPRELHLSVALQDGTILIAGGFDNNGNPVSNVEIFNPSTGGFTTLSNPINSTNDAGVAIVLQNGMVLFVGTGAELYNPNSQTFTQLPNPPLDGAASFPNEQVLTTLTATLLNDGRVLLISRLHAAIFDPSSAQFTQVGDMTMTRCGYTATALPSGQVLVAGGISTCSDTSGSPTSTAETFNPRTNQFTALAAVMNYTRRNHTATALYDGTILIAGGFPDTHGDSILCTAEIYNPSTLQFASASNLMTYCPAAQNATLLTSGAVLIDGSFPGSNDAEVYTYPYTLGSLNPKFLILGVVYSPPGSSSTVGYSQTTAVGTTTSLSNSTQQGTTVTTTIGGKKKILGISGSQSQTWTSESDASSSYSVNATTVAGIGTKGPLSSAIGVDHNFDYVLVWLNPKMSLGQGANPQTVLWGGYTYDTNDTNVDNDMDIVQIYVSCLANYYSTNSTCTDNNYRTARSWDTSGLGGLTASDYATILAADPFAANPNYDPITDTSGRYDLYSSIDYTPAPQGSGASYFSGTFTNTATSMAGMGTSMTYTVSDSFDASIASMLSLDFKASSTTTVTNKWSQNYNQSIGQSATFTIYGPVATDDYTGPTAFSVFRDNIYGTYMFYAPGVPPSSPGQIALTPNQLTFPSTVNGTAAPAQQVTLTYTAGPNETSNSVSLALQSPVFTFSNPVFSIQNGSDTCTGRSLNVGGSCTFNVIYSPTTSDETTHGTLLATGLTDGILSNQYSPLILSGQPAQQLGLQATMSTTSFSTQTGSVVSGTLSCNYDLNCSELIFLVDGVFGTSTWPLSEDGNFSINMTSIPASLLTPGPHILTVQAPGEPGWAAAVPVTIPFTVTALTTPTLTISMETTQVPYEQGVMVTGNVNCNSACGSVVLTVDGTNWQTETLDSNGNFTTYFSTDYGELGYQLGSHVLSGEYLGNSQYTTATANPITFNVIGLD